MKERANTFLRFCDRYLGIPIVIFLSLFKGKRKWPQPIQTIAFLKTAGIGDAILLSAVIEEVKKQFPKKKILFFSGISNQEAAQLISGIRVISLPMTKPLKALSLIRKERVDLWMDFDPWPRITALFSFFSRSKFTMGFKTRHQYRHFLYDSSIEHSLECHELENYRKLIRPLGIEPSLLPSIKCSSHPSQKCKVALHLFAGGSRANLKEWPKENWKKLIRFLLQKDCNVLLTGSEKDKERLKEFVVDQKVVNLAGKCTLRETADILASCHCLVSIDTGIMHLGAAIGMRVLALHGPTSPSRWGGKGKKVISLTPDLNYTPFIQLGFERKGISTMHALSFEKVKKQLERCLENHTGSKGSKDEDTDSGRGKRKKALAPIKDEIS